MFKKEGLIKFLISAIFITSVMLLSYFRVFEVFELQTLDLRFKIRPSQKTNPDIVIIEIAEDTIEKLGRWPFDRKYHIFLIKALNEAGAKQIIFDVLFSEESDSDSFLANSIEYAQNVYLPYSFRLIPDVEGEIEAQSIESFIIEDLKKVAEGYGHINIVPDRDGKNRKVPVYIKYKDKYYPHISFVAACDYLQLKEDDIIFIPQDKIILKDTITLPLNKRNELLINYADRWGKAFTHYSFIDIVGSYILKKENKEPLIDLSKLKDKVCFVAVTALGLYDLQAVPFAKRYPGVGIHANLFNSITTKNFLIRLNRWINLIILIALLSVIIWLSKIKSVKRSLIYVAGTILSYILLSILLFIYLHIWMDLFYPILAAILLYLGLTFYCLIAERHRRQLIEKELVVARRIQQSFLPKDPPNLDSIDIASFMKPAREVGGDLYQFISTSKDKLSIMIADVSGKGIPAALFMVRVVTEFKIRAGKYPSPKMVLSEVNNQLLKESKTGLFVTVSYCLVDTESMEVLLSDAGHLPVLFYDAKLDEVKEIRPEKGMPIGLLPNVEFNDELINLSKGDVLLFYTDGVTEARDTKAQEFGLDRLKDILKTYHHQTAPLILDGIKSELKDFSKKAPQHDDITLIVLKVV